MRTSFSVIVLSSALLVTGAHTADAAGVQAAAPAGVSSSVSAGLRKVIKTKASKGAPVVVKTGVSRKVIKTSVKPRAKVKQVKPTKQVIKTTKRK